LTGQEFDESLEPAGLRYAIEKRSAIDQRAQETGDYRDAKVDAGIESPSRVSWLPIGRRQNTRPQAWLADDQHQLPIALPCPLLAPRHRGDLLVPTDEHAHFTPASPKP
jgi:hypothetical protein